MGVGGQCRVSVCRLTPNFLLVSDEVRKRTEECGFDRNLIKPPDIKELEKILGDSQVRDHAEP